MENFRFPVRMECVLYTNALFILCIRKTKGKIFLIKKKKFEHIGPFQQSKINHFAYVCSPEIYLGYFPNCLIQCIACICLLHHPVLHIHAIHFSWLILFEGHNGNFKQIHICKPNLKAALNLLAQANNKCFWTKKFYLSKHCERTVIGSLYFFFSKIITISRVYCEANIM